MTYIEGLWSKLSQTRCFSKQTELKAPLFLQTEIRLVEGDLKPLVSKVYFFIIIIYRNLAAPVADRGNIFYHLLCQEAVQEST